MGHDARNGVPAFTSPACAMGEADDVYMGYAGRDEILAALNALLEASRAGARSALATEPQAPTGPTLALLQAALADETDACRMLLGHIRALGGVPSPHIGAAHGKAMALPDAGDRIAFLNRERGQVVYTLRKLLPRIRDLALHADLKRLLATQETRLEQGKEALSRERGHRQNQQRPRR
jgi:hypothetical protein